MLPGWWAEADLHGGPLSGEFEWEGRALHADLGAEACQVRVPQIKYSWLIARHPPSVGWVARFEDWLEETLPDVPVVRVDELLRLKWEAQAGRSWWAIPHPVGDLRDWLLCYEFGRPLDSPSHFRFLPD
jgi:hypothetical protein